MIAFEHVSQRYGTGHPVLSDLSFEMQRGELLVLTGASGAGKSTVLRLALALESPSAGRIRVGGTDLTALKRAALPVFRRSLGYVPQDALLLADRSVLANVALPAHAAGLPTAECEQRARAALTRVGLNAQEIATRPPQQLSGGQQQRVALARALVNRPALLLVDEPTAHLDAAASAALMDLLDQFAAAGVSVLVATHDETSPLPARARRLTLREGKLTS